MFTSDQLVSVYGELFIVNEPFNICLSDGFHSKHQLSQMDKTHTEENSGIVKEQLLSNKLES